VILTQVLQKTPASGAGEVERWSRSPFDGQHNQALRIIQWKEVEKVEGL